MKIAIASDNQVNIADHFGRTRGFIIYDIDNGVIKNQQYRINAFTAHARGKQGTGHASDRHGPVMEALKDCNVVISRGMGQRMYNELHNIGINTFIVDENDASTAVNKYLRDELANHPGKRCEHRA